jgi:hypothetical protein
MALGDHSIKVTATLKVDGVAAKHDSTLGFEEGVANVMDKNGKGITPNKDGTFTITSDTNGAIEFNFYYDKEVIFTPYVVAADDQSQKMDLPEYIAFMTVKPVVGNFGYPVIENNIGGVIQIDPSQTIIPVSLPRMAIANYSDWKQAKTALLVQGAKTQIYFGDLAEVITSGYPVSVAGLNTDGTGENTFRYMFFNGETADDGMYVTYTAVFNDDADSRPTDLRKEIEIARMYNYNTEITSPSQPIDFWFPLPTAPAGDYQKGNIIQIELRLDAYKHGTNTPKHGHVTATTQGLAQTDFDAATKNGYIVITFTPQGGNLDDYSMSKDGGLGSFEIDYTVMDSSGRVLGRPIDTVVGTLNTGGPRSREK